MDFLLSTPLPPIAVSLAVMFFLGVIFLRNKQNKRYPPVAGTVFQALINRRKLLHYMTGIVRKYRTYRMLGFFRYIVFTADPANVEYMLKTNVANYGKGHYLQEILSANFGEGIFNSDGDRWRHQRKVSSSQLSTKVLRDFSTEIFKTNAVKLGSIIHEAATCGKSIEMQVLFFKSTMDSIVKILLGIDLDTMSGTNNEESVRVFNAFDDVNEASIHRFAGMWKIQRFLNIGREAVIRKNLVLMDNFLYNLINRKIENLRKSEEQDEQPRRDFISKLLEAKETDPKYLRDMVFNFIAAGKDTTASALTWFIYMMCKHPDIQEKVAHEVREATGLNNTSRADEVAANLTEEALSKMQYLHAALTETLRLYPSVPLNARVCFSDDTWPDGYSVKKGELVIFQSYSMGWMKFIWGDDAEEFRPERWLDGNGNFKDESPFKFIAFNAGPRICLGRDYSYLQMKIYSAVLLNNYIFKLTDENKVVRYKNMITLHSDEGLHVHAFPRV